MTLRPHWRTTCTAGLILACAVVSFTSRPGPALAAFGDITQLLLLALASTVMVANAVSNSDFTIHSTINNWGIFSSPHLGGRLPRCNMNSDAAPPPCSYQRGGAGIRVSARLASGLRLLAPRTGTNRKPCSLWRPRFDWKATA